MIDNHQAISSQRMVSLALGKNVLSWKSICVDSDMLIRVRVVSRYYCERNVVVPASAKDYLRPLESPPSMLHSAPTTTNSGYGKFRREDWVCIEHGHA